MAPWRSEATRDISNNKLICEVHLILGDSDSSMEPTPSSPYTFPGYIGDATQSIQEPTGSTGPTGCTGSTGSI